MLSIMVRLILFMVCPLGWNRISCAIILRILLPVTLVNDQSTISFALPIPVDPDLLTILNKAINNLSESERTVIRNRNLESIGVSEFSLTDFIYANPLQFMFIVMFVLSVLFTALLLAIGARMKATVIQGNLKRAEAANLAKSEFLFPDES